MLERSFYARPALEVARDLIGLVLVRRGPEGLVAGRNPGVVNPGVELS